MLRRVLATVLLMACTVLVLANAGPLARGWPWANPQAIKRDISVSDGEQTLRPLAERLVRSDPMQIESLSRLALIDFQYNRPKLADRTLRVAGQLGWRDPLVQNYWMLLSIQAGAWQPAAQRLDALLRIDAEPPYWQSGFDTMIANPAGRDALADRLAEDPHWAHSELVNFSPSDTPPERIADRIALLEAGWRKGLRINCGDLNQLTSNIFHANQTDIAYRLWVTHCDPEMAKGERNGVFQLIQPDGDNTLFGWQLGSAGNFNVDWTTQNDGSPALEINTSSSIKEMVAKRYIGLAPGAYQLAWRATNSANQATDQVGFQLTCMAKDQGRGDDIPLNATKVRDNGRTADFIIPAGPGCPLQTLAISVAPPGSALTQNNVAIQGMIIRRVSAARQ